MNLYQVTFNVQLLPTFLITDDTENTHEICLLRAESYFAARQIAEAYGEQTDKQVHSVVMIDEAKLLNKLLTIFIG